MCLLYAAGPVWSPSTPVLLTDRVDTHLRLGNPELTERQVTDVMARVGLPATFGERRTGGLSGGKAQRVCLACALAVGPEALLLDEPTSALVGLNVAVIVEMARAATNRAALGSDGDCSVESRRPMAPSSGRPCPRLRRRERRFESC